MIKTKNDLNRCLQLEAELYNANHWYSSIRAWFIPSVSTQIYKYIRLLRFTEYFHNNSFHKTGIKKNILNDLFYLFYLRRKSKLGAKLGLEVGLNSVDEGMLIYHAGYLVVNYEARIGKNVRFHGCNCVGNSTSGVPTIGDNVEFGVGSSVIGGITIADHVKIGAGAVVTKSVLEPGSVVGGVPAKKIK